MNRTTMRRGARRVCALGAVACAGLALVPTSADAQSTDDAGPVLPDVFSGSASALAVSAELDRAGLLPVPHLFRFILADSTGTYSASEQRARASVIFPGNGLVQGPALACSQIPPEAEPIFGPIVDACLGYSFPLSVTADPLEPDHATEGAVAMGTPADPLSLRAVNGRAHAGIDAVTSSAAAGDLRVLGAPSVGPLPAVPGMEDLEPYLVHVGSGTSDTDQRIDETGALVVDAVAALSDIGFIGGLVRIDSLVSHARIVDGEGEPVTEASMDLSGVTVAGMPARVTDGGLEIGDASTPLGPALEALGGQMASVLESLSFRMVALPVEQGVDDAGLTNAHVGGLLIEMAVPLDGMPSVPGPLGDIDLNGDYVGTVVLGDVGARGVATDIDSSADPSPVVPPAVGGGVSPIGTDRGGSAPPSPSAAPGTDAPTAPAPGADEEDPSIGLVADLFADRLELLYLAFTLAALAICLAPRLSLPARLPGARHG